MRDQGVSTRKGSETPNSERARPPAEYAVDAVGVLYRITRALTEFDVDIRSAHVQTLGTQVVDAFYVVDNHGCKITSTDDTAEIERAIIHALSNV
jgi:UTP:GlnB (protein PII) uridylyltransferase